MNTRKHTIRSTFLIFLCMMLMMCITACGEKTIKEYPNLMNEHIGLNKGALSYELNVPSIKKINEGVYSQRSLDSYLDGDLQILNDGGYLVIKVMTSDVNNTAMIDYVLSYFQDEFGELKFEKV